MLELPTFSPRDFQQVLATRELGRYLVYRESTASTMDVARREAAEGAPHGTLVFAEEQTAGRGRRGRSFFSPPRQNLYFTLVLRCPIELHRRLPILVPLAVCRAVSAVGVRAAIKWPNDIWARERKLSGMLIDAELTAAGAVALPGIGINVNGDPTRTPGLENIATSVCLELGHEVSREHLLASVCNELESLLAADPLDAGNEYKAASCVLGQRVRVQPITGGSFEGQAEAIDADGALWVRRDSGTRELVTAADVSLRPLTP